MSAAAWLQLLVLIALLRDQHAAARLATWRRCTAAARPPATASSARSSALIYRVCGVDPEQRAALDHLRAARCSPSASSRCSSSTRSCGSRATCRSTPTTQTGVDAGAVVQHRGQLPHQHELAELLGRVDDVAPHPDGRARGAELRVGRGRRGRRGRPHPRPRPPAHAHASATSGSTSPARPSASCCRSRSSFALVLVSQGVVQNFHAHTHRHHRRRARRRRSPAARSRARRRSRSSARTAAAPYNANSSHPFENPNGDHQPARDLAAPRASRSRFTWTFGKMVRRPEAGLGALRARCSCCGSSAALVAMALRGARQPEAHRAAASTRRPPPPSPAATWRARRPASGPAACGLFAGLDDRHVDRRRSTAMHDSFTPLGGAAPLVNIMLGEVEPRRHRRRPLRHADLRAARRCSSPA